MNIELKTFIERMGDEQAAALLGEKVRTVASWRRGERMPSRRKIPGIVKKSRGTLTYSSFFDPQDQVA